MLQDPTVHAIGKRSRSVAVLAVLAVTLAGCGGKPVSRVVLYCSQDQSFAERVLPDFSKLHGLSIAPKFDTEANKSIGLFRELQMEAKHPRCDVFWNNEILNTMRLASEGLLEPYDTPAAKPFPEYAKAADHTWHAFAARARVLLVNSEGLKGDPVPDRLHDLLDPKWRGRLAMAKPLHGTTATQAACLFEVLGTEAARQFYQGLKANEVKVFPGNKHVAEAVGRGDVAIGLTDTDDAMDEVLAGRPVSIVFTDAAGGTTQFPRLGTLFIPNTLAMIKGCPNPAGAQKLVDYLLSEQVEAKLATAGGYQIPLNPDVKCELPAALQPVRNAKPMQVDFAKAAAIWDEAQTFLRNEFAR